ncbi:hypothetical protein [Pasteurella multocida]|nr:hypothetical protein [Pasteurella multocida]MCL7767774.1 hypothetical protein [Pasteurella multocida]
MKKTIMKHINIWDLTGAFILALILGIGCHPVSPKLSERTTDLSQGLRT